jgi:hypothetical protein
MAEAYLAQQRDPAAASLSFDERLGILPIDRWHEHLGDPTLADAILDRIVHRAHRLALTGPSRRKTTGNGPSSSKEEA